MARIKRNLRQHYLTRYKCFVLDRGNVPNMKEIDVPASSEKNYNIEFIKWCLEQIAEWKKAKNIRMLINGMTTEKNNLFTCWLMRKYQLEEDK